MSERGTERIRCAEEVASSEDAARFTALEKKLAPLKIESVLEPSHALINGDAQCLEDARLRYTEWSKVYFEDCPD